MWGHSLCQWPNKKRGVGYKMTTKICNGCNEKIDNKVKNSLTIGSGDKEVTICEDCAKDMMKR